MIASHRRDNDEGDRVDLRELLPARGRCDHHHRPERCKRDQAPHRAVRQGHTRDIGDPGQGPALRSEPGHHADEGEGAAGNPVRMIDERTHSARRWCVAWTRARGRQRWFSRGRGEPERGVGDRLVCNKLFVPFSFVRVCVCVRLFLSLTKKKKKRAVVSKDRKTRSSRRTARRRRMSFHQEQGDPRRHEAQQEALDGAGLMGSPSASPACR